MRHGWKRLALAALVPLALASAACAARSAGSDGAAPASTTTPTGRSSRMQLTSAAFTEGSRIPARYVAPKAGGEGMSIPFEWSGAPEDTKSFVLAIIDHAPVANEWVHWVVVDIPPDVTSIPEAASGTAAMPNGSRELYNTGGSKGYGGPAAPPGTGDHPYEATVYALSVPALDMPDRVTSDELDRALEGKVLAKASLTGIFSR